MQDDAASPLVTSAEIARLAGVGRAAVSNWRRRYPDFPQPTGGPASSPTFALADVEKWLADTGKGEQLRTSGVTSTGTQRIDRTADRFIQMRGRPSGSGRATTASGDGAGSEDEGDGDLAAWLDFGPDALSLAEVRAKKVRRAQYESRSVFAAMMVGLLPESTVGGFVLDPACGRGDLLAAAVTRFGPDVMLAGQDVDVMAARTASARLAADRAARLIAVDSGDSLTDNRLGVFRSETTAVLCEPPLDQPAWPADELATDPRWVFGLPAPRDAELAWVQHCYSSLRPGGTAVVAVSPRTSVQPSGRAIRAAMLRAGVLHAVVALPEGAGWGGTNVSVWVLRRPAGEADHTVAMVDLTNVDAVELPTDDAAWRAVFADSARCRRVAGIELLDEDVALLPSRFVERAPSEVAGAYLSSAERLPKLLRQLADGLPQLSQTFVKPDFQMMTLHELERAGALRIQPRTVTPKAGDVLVHMSKHLPTVATGKVADEARSVTHVIEIDGDRLDPHFVAAFLHADAAAIPSANTAGSLSREDLRRCRVPRLSIVQQRRYGKAFRTLTDLDAVLRATADVSGLVMRIGIDGLTSGALAPPD